MQHIELPSAFADDMQTLLGDADYHSFLASLSQDPPVSIRLNRKKQLKWLLPESNVSDRVPWCLSGVYLEERPSFTFDPLFHAGCYYVQEASSMFLDQVLRQCLPADQPVAMLDLCAAPGGKSTLALDALPEGSLMVANEVIRPRAQVLLENLSKWGNASIVVTNSDSLAFSSLAGCFDVLLADVPCSGEGMFRKDGSAVDEWNEAAVENCWRRQRSIVSNAWPCLKSGGLFIYSTCTYNVKENEENVSWICRELGAEPVVLHVPQEWEITGQLLEACPASVYRFLPHKLRGEGFFLCVLRKTSEEGLSARQKTSGGRDVAASRRRTVTGNVMQMARLASGWTDAGETFEMMTDDNTLTLFPARWKKLLALCRKHLHVMQAGLTLGALHGKDLVPAHMLAMSLHLNKDAFLCSDLSLEQAIAYLRREQVILPSSFPRGMVLLTYQGVPLGFVKNIGNRTNSLYPQEWRIRTSYKPF